MMTNKQADRMAKDLAQGEPVKVPCYITHIMDYLCNQGKRAERTRQGK